MKSKMEKNTEALNIRVSKEEKEKLLAIAEREDRNINQVVRLIIKERLTESK